VELLLLNYSIFLCGSSFIFYIHIKIYIPGVHKLADDLKNSTKNLCMNFRDLM
jgi:hypothetical protein